MIRLLATRGGLAISIMALTAAPCDMDEICIYAKVPQSCMLRAAVARDTWMPNGDSSMALMIGLAERQIAA